MPVLRAEAEPSLPPFPWKRFGVYLLRSLLFLFLIGVLLRVLGYTEVSSTFSSYLTLFLLPFYSVYLANPDTNQEESRLSWTSQCCWILKFTLIIAPTLILLSFSFRAIYNYLA